MLWRVLRTRAGISETGDQTNLDLFRPRRGVRSENPKLRQSDNRIYFFFSFPLELFLSQPAAARSSFALFLLLRDHFRSCGRSFSFSRDRLFFNGRREDGERGQIGLHFGVTPGGS